MMKRVISYMLLLLLGLGARAATPVRYELKVNEFHELKVVDAINVVYSCNPDSTGLAVFTCDSEDAAAFIFNNPKGKGVLSMQLSTESVKKKNLPTIHVYSTYLTKVENSGDSLVKVLNVANGPKFSAQLIGNGRLVVNNVKATEVNAGIATGNGTLIISGQCESAKIKLVGTGVIQADELKADYVSVKASGTGSVGVDAVSELSVSGVGSTKVYYKGEPKIKNRTLGIKTMKL